MVSWEDVMLTMSNDPRSEVNWSGVDWEEEYFTCPKCGEKIYEHEWQGIGKKYPNYYVPCPHCYEDIVVDEEERKQTQFEDDLIVLMNTIGF